MQLTREQTLHISPQSAWRALNDVAVLRACIPGCASVRAVSSNRFDVVVVASLGPVRAKINGELQVLPRDDLHPPKIYTLCFEGHGGIIGRIRGEAQVELQTRGADRSALRYAARATLDGGVIRLGAHFMDRAAQELADEFFAAFDAHVRQLAG